jgi:hypothetical protein
MAGQKANVLPSTSTVNNMNIQRLILSQKQLCETFASKENTCLCTDEASKFGDNYGGFHASDEDGNLYVLGLRDLVTKSASDSLDTFISILSDLDDRL